ncbi:MAG: ATPase [Bacteroidetes bacterium]|nr:ATPase [Bacteroidota bacterium]NCG14094.1 ATPase [Bacteroidota bacterium]
MNKLSSLLFAVLMMASLQSFGQKKVEIRFEVDGICGMCETRIEKALLETPGVWAAEWDKASHEVFVVYKPKKVSEMELHRAVAAVGHDTKKVKAKSEIYHALNDCCKYKDEDVVKNHK